MAPVFVEFSCIYASSFPNEKNWIDVMKKYFADLRYASIILIGSLEHLITWKDGLAYDVYRKQENLALSTF